ncbi:hypothetical protein HRbin36_02720 [bacterium HR36]|nr:hypothetical protein HRbin36_02720 [bacterium HR36]
MLDERNHRATTLGTIGLYSPITPPGGVQWDYEIEPVFLNQVRHLHELPSSGFGPYRPGPYEPDRTVMLDWSEKQHLVSGWVMPRVREYVLARRNEVRRERLTLRREGERLFAANNFGVALKNLILCDQAGRWWQADFVAAGAEVELQPTAPPEQYQKYIHALQEPHVYLGSNGWAESSAGLRYDRYPLPLGSSPIPSVLSTRATPPPGTRPSLPITSPTPASPGFPGAAPRGGTPPSLPVTSPTPSGTGWKRLPGTAPLGTAATLPGEARPGEDAPPAVPKGTLPPYCPGTLSTWMSRGQPRWGSHSWLDTLCSAGGPEAAALLCPGRYLAELDGNPFLPVGLRWIGVREERCWIVGILETVQR